VTENPAALFSTSLGRAVSL